MDRRTLCVQTVVRMHDRDTVKLFPLAGEEGMGAREDAALAETPLPTAEGGGCPSHEVCHSEALRLL